MHQSFESSVVIMNTETTLKDFDELTSIIGSGPVSGSRHREYFGPISKCITDMDKSS